MVVVINELSDVSFQNSKVQIIKYTVEDIRFIMQRITDTANADYTDANNNVRLKKLSDTRLLLIDTLYLFNQQLLSLYNISYDVSFPHLFKFDEKATPAVTFVNFNVALEQVKYNLRFPISILQNINKIKLVLF